MNSTVAETNDEARPEVDVVLREYFQAEMPHPWPSFRAPLSLRAKQPTSPWVRYCGRGVMAACVALLIGGYIALSGYFPRQPASHGLTPINTIGQKEKGTSGNPVMTPMPND